MCEALNRTDVKSFISITPVRWEIVLSFNSVWTSLTDNERTYKAGQYHSSGLQLSELIQNKRVGAPFFFFLMMHACTLDWFDPTKNPPPKKSCRILIASLETMRAHANTQWSSTFSFCMFNSLGRLCNWLILDIRPPCNKRSWDSWMNSNICPEGSWF